MPTEPESTRWVFPDPTEVEGDVVAVGADLEPGTILSAYRLGLFPIPAPELGGLAWWSPMNRGVLTAGRLRVTRSMRQSANRFRITVDEAFRAVVDGCADPAREGGWIDEDIKTAYARLHALGWAHSVEVWSGPDLAGGLYGVAIGGLFAGESMFYRRRDASKVALMALVALLDDGVAGRLLDVQWATPHLRSLGVVTVSRVRYQRLLNQALALPLPARWMGAH